MKKAIITILSIALAVSFSMAEAKSNKEKELPPGLQKKLARSGELPPGWEKKLTVGERLDNEVYNEADVVVPVDEHGVVTVEIEGKVVRLMQASREIVEILK